MKATCQDAQIERTAQKLAIEKAYWLEKGVVWKLVVSSELNRTLTDNLELLHHWRNIRLSLPLIAQVRSWCREFLSGAPCDKPICALASFKHTFGEMNLNGFEAMQILLARKLCGGPIQSMPVPFIKIGDIGEEQC